MDKALFVFRVNEKQAGHNPFQSKNPMAAVAWFPIRSIAIGFGGMANALVELVKTVQVLERNKAFTALFLARW